MDDLSETRMTREELQNLTQREIEQRLVELQEKLKDIEQKKAELADAYRQKLEDAADVDDRVRTRRLAIQAKVKKVRIEQALSVQRQLENHLLKWELVRGKKELSDLESIVDDDEPIQIPPFNFGDFEEEVIKQETDAAVEREQADSGWSMHLEPLEEEARSEIDLDDVGPVTREIDHIKKIGAGEVVPEEIDPLEEE